MPTAQDAEQRRPAVSIKRDSHRDDTTIDSSAASLQPLVTSPTDED